MNNHNNLHLIFPARIKVSIMDILFTNNHSLHDKNKCIGAKTLKKVLDSLGINYSVACWFDRVGYFILEGKRFNIKADKNLMKMKWHHDRNIKLTII